jgi:uncharacterized damage-inducible protein DinB
VIDNLVDLYESCFRGEPMAWHASSTMPLLKDITAERASKHPIEGAHSIWEIINHLPVYEESAIKALEGGKFPMFMDGEEWPARKDYSEEAWICSVKLLEDVHDRFVDAIREFDVNRFGELIDMDNRWPEPWQSTTYYQFLNGMLHHKVYHTAQIALLKKHKQ